MKEYKAVKMIGRLRDEEVVELIYRAVRRNRIEIMAILEKAANELGDEKLIKFMKDLYSEQPN